MPLRPARPSTGRLSTALLSLLLGASLVTVAGPATATVPDPATRAANPCSINVTMDELSASRSPSTHGRGSVVCQKTRGKIWLQMNILYRRNSTGVYENITYAGKPVKKNCQKTISCVIGATGGHNYDRRGWSGEYCVVLYWKYGNATEFLQTQTCRHLEQP